MWLKFSILSDQQVMWKSSGGGRTATFNHTGEVGRESYQKALVDSLIAFDADYFIGRYASSASYLLKIKRREKNVSMYCANSGFMCSDRWAHLS